jgi:hypothetical protein
MTNEIYTENLADFGARERRMLAEILALPLPSEFCDSGVKPAFNRNSGYVFLVNDDYQCAMLNDDSGKLEIFHITPYRGHEGFITDLLEEYKPDDLHADDAEYIRYMADREGANIPEAWV